MKINTFNKLDRTISDEINIKNLKIGDIVKGRVINNEKGLITLRTSGNQLISALFLPDEHLFEGKVISIIINKITEDNIYARILKTDGFDNKIEKDINHMIQELGIGKSVRIKEILENLLKFLQPVNKDKIEYINYLLKTSEDIVLNKVETFSNLLISEENFLELPMDVLNKLPLTEQLAVCRDYISDLINKADIAVLKDGDNDLLLKNMEESLNLKGDEIDDIKDLAYKIDKTISSAENINIETISYLLSKDVEISPQNLFVFDNLVSKGRGPADYLTEIINVLKDSNQPDLVKLTKELLNVYEEADKFNKDSYINQINKLINTMKKLEETLEKKDITKFRLKDNIQNLKSILSIVKSINKHSNYYNMPMIVNNFKSSADIYIYKKSKKGKRIDLSDAHILISLDMQNIGHIEGLIQVSKNLVNISFKTENKIVSNLINKYSKNFIDLLESKGYVAVISVAEKRDEKINPISFESRLNKEKEYKQGIDVRL